MTSALRTVENTSPDFASAVRGPRFNALGSARTPSLVAFPVSEGEVIEAIALARASGRRVTVRSGGHNWVAPSERDGVVVIDMGAFTEASIDADALAARVQPGIRGGRLAALLDDHGVAFPVGHCGTPGVGGYLLSGGLGVNWGDWLPACFSVTGVRVVLADGSVAEATESENPELLWLARGSGAGFPGVVTRFDLALRPMPSAIRLSTWTYALADLPAVTAWMDAALPSLPANVELAVALSGPERADATADDEPHVVALVATVFADTPEEARAALAAFELAPVPPLAHDDLLEVAFRDLHVGVDATYPSGHRYVVDTFWTSEDYAGTLDRLAPLVASAPSGNSYILSAMPGHGTGATLIPQGPAAYTLHDSSAVIVYTIWEDTDADAVNRAWLDAVTEALRPITTGHALSEADLFHPEGRAARSFRPEAWVRIQELRARFDPDGVFAGYPELD